MSATWVFLAIAGREVGIALRLNLAKRTRFQPHFPRCGQGLPRFCYCGHCPFLPTFIKPVVQERLDNEAAAIVETVEAVEENIKAVME